MGGCEILSVFYYTLLKMIAFKGVVLSFNKHTLVLIVAWMHKDKFIETVRFISISRKLNRFTKRYC